MLNLKDAALTQTGALPNGAAQTLTSALNLLLSSQGELDFRGEFEIEAPALTTSQLANAATMTYDVIASAASNLGTPTVIYPGILVQTGASGAGAAAATVRFKLPYSPGSSNGVPNSLTYLGVRATNSGSGNASSVSVTLNPVF